MTAHDDRLAMTVYWSRWDRFRLWLHGRIYRTLDIAADGDGGLLISCSCGGHASVRRLDDGRTAVGEVTCGLWARLKARKVRRPCVPAARALPAAHRRPKL